MAKRHAYFEQYEFTLATHWASAIINGDDSGLSCAESTQLDEFLSYVAESKGPGHWAGFDEKTSNFTRDEITGLLANCETAIYCAVRMVPISRAPLREGDVTLHYLNLLNIVTHKESPVAPYSGRGALGYGRKIPINRMVQLFDKRWRRVYACQYSNAGTAYILVKGDWWIIGPEAESIIDPNGV